MYTKYMLGGAYLVMIIGAIWFPLVLFAVGGTVGTANRPTDVSVDMEISGFVPIASMAATKVNHTYLNETQYSKMLNTYKSKKEAVAFLSNSGYDMTDTTIVRLNGRSVPIWGISPPSKEALIKELNRSIISEEEDGENTRINIDFRVSVKISRTKAKGQAMEAEVMRNYDFHLSKRSKQDLKKVLSLDPESLKQENNLVLLETVFPNFLRVPEKAEPETIKQLEREPNIKSFRNIGIRLKSQKGMQWFEVEDTCISEQDPYYGFWRTDGDDNSFVLLMLINEKVFPGALAVVSGYGYDLYFE